jgi:DNA-binding MarR family transcriptional regulator
MRVGAQLLKSAEHFYTSLKLTGAQYNVLRILEGAGEAIPQQEIADKLLVSRANVTGLLDKLEAKGLLERLPCEDRRVNMIQLTAGGFGLLEKSFPEVTENSIQAMSCLTTDEQKTLVRLLEKLKD